MLKVNFELNDKQAGIILFTIHSFGFINKKEEIEGIGVVVN
ncbi:hypothetical protein [Thermococcus paralvinellae]|nr:hypothetical protein [Thermococcus paralvinellae]